METIELSTQEVQGFERARADLATGDLFSLEASRFVADFGPVVEIVQLYGPVHAAYSRDGGRWVEQFEQDLRKGLFDQA